MSTSFPTSHLSSQRDPKTQRKSEFFAFLVATSRNPRAEAGERQGENPKLGLELETEVWDPTRPSPHVPPNLNLRTSIHTASHHTLVLREVRRGAEALT